MTRRAASRSGAGIGSSGHCAGTRGQPDQDPDAARDSFAEHGYEASMEDIAVRADVGIGTLYRRFPNKADLLNAVVEAAQERNVRSQRRSSTTWTPRKECSNCSPLHCGAQLLAGDHWLAVEDERNGTRRDCSSARRDPPAQPARGSVRSDIEVADIVVLLMAVRSIGTSATRNLPSRLCASWSSGSRPPPRHQAPVHDPLTIAQLDRISAGADGRRAGPP